MNNNNNNPLYNNIYLQSKEMSFQDLKSLRLREYHYRHYLIFVVLPNNLLPRVVCQQTKPPIISLSIVTRSLSSF